MASVFSYSRLSLDEFSSLLGRLLTSVLQLSPGRFEGSIEAVGLNGCMLMRCHGNQATLVHGQIPDEVGFCLPLEPYDFYANGRVYKPQQQLASFSEQSLTMLAPENSGRLLLSFSHDLLESVLGRAGYADFIAQVRKITEQGMIYRGKAGLTARLEGAFDELLEAGGNARGDAEASLVKLVHRYIGDELDYEQSSAGSHERIIERTLTAVTDNPQVQPSMDELAELCFSCRRNVSYAFNSQAGISPSRFIRRLKFNEIRRRFRGGAAQAWREKPSQLFLEYGFSNPGRAMREYTAFFGEAPAGKQPFSPGPEWRQMLRFEPPAVGGPENRSESGLEEFLRRRVWRQAVPHACPENGR